MLLVFFADEVILSSSSRGDGRCIHKSIRFRALWLAGRSHIIIIPTILKETKSKKLGELHYNIKGKYLYAENFAA